MPNEDEQNALSKIRAYLDAGHSLDAVRAAGWASWIEHLTAKGYDLNTGQLTIAPPTDQPTLQAASPPAEPPNAALTPSTEAHKCAPTSAAAIPSIEVDEDTDGTDTAEKAHGLALDRIEDEIAKRSRRGWQLTSQTATTAQMRKPTRFSLAAALLWTLFFGVGLIIYVFWHMAKKEETVYMRIVDGRLKIEESGLLATLLRPVRAWWRWSGQRQTTWGKIAAFGAPLCGAVILIVIISIASASGGGDDRQLVAGDESDTAVAASAEPTDTPKPTWETRPVTRETVRAALDSLDDLGLVRPDIDPDNVTFLSVGPGVDGSGYIVAIQFKPGTTLGETDFLTVAGESTLIAMAKLFANPGVHRVKVSAMADLISALGNESTEFLTTATINRATADQINWQGFADRQLFDNKHIFCFADAFVIRPLIYNELKGKGCLPGPSRSEG